MKQAGGAGLAFLGPAHVNLSNILMCAEGCSLEFEDVDMLGLVGCGDLCIRVAPNWGR